MLNSFRRLFSNSQNRKARRASGLPRLELLSLEQRIVPSTFSVINTADSGAGSLRQAIIDANATAGDDIINFSITGTITLDSQNNAVNASLPTILDANATASGTGGTGTTVGTLTITGPGSSSLTISGLDGGNKARDFNIFNIATGGDLTISGVTVSGAQGGGFINFGTLTVNSSVISGNSAPGGAGILSHGNTNLTISNSTISGNISSGVGGAINGMGGCIINITNSNISNNSSGSNGGGICLGFSASLTISNSTISNNKATQNGGGIFNYGGNSQTNVTNSTISGNTATNGNGGGIFNNVQTFSTVLNSTISTNSAIQGGGIYNASTLNIANTIIANSTNGASTPAPIDDYAGTGTVNLIPSSNSNDPAIPANNIVTLDTSANSIASSAWAIIVSSANLNLGTLANNGGSTETIALTSLSPSSVTSLLPTNILG